MPVGYGGVARYQVCRLQKACDWGKAFEAGKVPFETGIPLYLVYSVLTVCTDVNHSLFMAFGFDLVDE